MEISRLPEAGSTRSWIGCKPDLELVSADLGRDVDQDCIAPREKMHTDFQNWQKKPESSQTNMHLKGVSQTRDISRCQCQRKIVGVNQR